MIEGLTFPFSDALYDERNIENYALLIQLTCEHVGGGTIQSRTNESLIMSDLGCGN